MCKHQRKLDRGLVNQQWRIQYPDASVLHAPTIASDHLPLILNTEGNGLFLPRPFRFEAMWVRDPNNFVTVDTVWHIPVDGQPALVLSKKVAKVKRALHLWNKTHFGFIKDRLRLLTHFLDHVQ